jgi:ketosteroid isomerase-like protein
MSDTTHRELCHELFDAIEQRDVERVARCYAPEMTMWFNGTGAEQTREENLATLEAGYRLHRRRTYDDRRINTFDDGFLVQYSLNVVAHDGSTHTLWACLVAEVRDGLITKLYEYLDTGKFARKPLSA